MNMPEVSHAGAVAVPICSEAPCHVMQATPTLAFPSDAIVGSLGELAHVISNGTEIPAAFVYGAALGVMGAMCSGNLDASVGLDSDTRLYVVLYGESADAKKSSALQKVIRFFDELGSTRSPAVQNGVGSAEGL